MKLSILILVALIFTGCQSEKKNFDDIAIVDTHIHFYDPARPGGVAWPPQKDSVLYKAHYPKNFNEVVRHQNIKATVVVEASDKFLDNKWILDITKSNKDQYVALVGNLAVGSGHFDKEFAELCKDPRFVGLRIRPRKDYPYFTPKFYQDLKTMADKGKTLDILMVGIDLAGVAKIAKKVPTLKILINHVSGLPLGKKNAVNDAWKKQIAAVAQYSNVYCKISGLYERVGYPWAPTDLAFYKPCLDTLVENFGEDRLVYGSNWPVLNRSGNYTGYKSLIMDFCEQYDRDFAEKFLQKNAIKFYSLPK
jgi:L-fuconolactonase